MRKRLLFISLVELDDLSRTLILAFVCLLSLSLPCGVLWLTFTGGDYQFDDDNVCLPSAEIRERM